MKITCSKTELCNALRIVSKAIASKPQSPILSGIFMKTTENQLELQATNYELSFISRLPATIDEPGQMTLAGHYILEVISKMPGEQVSLSLPVGEKMVTIQSDKATFKLLSMEAAEFPQIQPISGNIHFQLKDALLRKLIQKTVFACSNEDSRPVFTGCSLSIKEHQVMMVATNTHRLSVMQTQIDESQGNINIIIPAKILSELAHTLNSDVPQPITVTCSPNQISFQTPDTYMSSRLIEGQFPSFDNIIPASFATHVKVKRELLAQSLERVSLISRVSNYNVVKLYFTDGNIHLSAHDPEVGNADDDIPAELNGPDLHIAFNVDYLKDVLRSMDSEVIRIGFNREISPAVLQEEDTDEFLYIVTPVRTTF